jgi:hypothetical protein
VPRLLERAFLDTDRDLYEMVQAQLAPGQHVVPGSRYAHLHPSLQCRRGSGKDGHRCGFCREWPCARTGVKVAVRRLLRLHHLSF